MNKKIPVTTLSLLINMFSLTLQFTRSSLAFLNIKQGVLQKTILLLAITLTACNAPIGTISEPTTTPTFTPLPTATPLPATSTSTPPPTNTSTPPSPTLTLESAIEYIIRVTTLDNQGIENARVTLESTEGLTPITGFTDSGGYARLIIPPHYEGEPARLIVEYEGYTTTSLLVDINRDSLPTIIKLTPLTEANSSDDAWSGDTTRVTRTPIPPPSESDIALTTALPTPNANFSVITRTVENGKEQVLVPAGWFIAGDHAGVGYPDEKPPHWVYIDEFWIDKFPTTNAEFANCGASLCGDPQNSFSHTREQYFGNPSYANYPVIYVTWEQARVSCELRGARLPTEAEFEKAAGWNPVTATTFTYPWGENPPDMNALANFGDPDRDTTSVGTFVRGVSPTGAYDMAGNVWHWTSDWYAEDYYVNNMSWINPQGASEGEFKVTKGGSWATDTPSHLRIPNRGIHRPHETGNIFGFRCVSIDS